MGKKEAIIDAAATLVYMKGFNNTSVEDVLAESKAGKGQFYHYFESKEQLGYAIIDRQFEMWKAQVLDRIFSERHGLEALDVFFKEMTDHFEETRAKGGCPFGNLAQELSDIHEGFRARLQKVFEAIINSFQRAYEESKVTGEIKLDVDSRKAAEFTFSAMQGALLLAKTRKDVQVFKDVCESLKGYIGSLSR